MIRRHSSFDSVNKSVCEISIGLSVLLPNTIDHVLAIVGRHTGVASNWIHDTNQLTSLTEFLKGLDFSCEISCIHSLDKFQ